MDWYYLTQSVIALLVITAPPDPAKILLFNSVIAEKKLSRTAAATRVALVVACVLGGAALGGAKIAALMGIDLNAFTVVGGVVVAGLGFEMLYGGKPSKTQGQQYTEHEPEQDSGLIMPLAIPLIAGPGAIVTCVSISSAHSGGMIAALAAAGSVALACWASFRWLGGLISKVSPETTSLLLRLGGMMLATIGMQMLLGGLKKFFTD